ncbi:MAG: methyl-accepting chemotaxis protein [Verrucomicrobia bacterium]|nr:methyl-accepting chemotaxis protein [Verrucomicrobiota bacterium]
MSNWTIVKRVTAGFAVVIIIAAGMSVFSIFRLDAIQTQTSEIQQDHLPMLLLAEQLQRHDGENSLYVHTYLHESDPADRAKLDKDIEANRTVASDLIKGLNAIMVDAQEKQIFGKFLSARTESLALEDKVLQLCRAQKATEAAALYDEQAPATLKRYQQEVDAFSEYNKTGAREAVKMILSSETACKNVLLYGSLLCLALSVWIAWSVIQSLRDPLARLLVSLEHLRKGNLTHRLGELGKDELGVLGEGLNNAVEHLSQLVGHVQKAGIQVNSSTTELAATLKEQQTTANEVAATTSEISATAHEISATTKELGKTMNEVARVAETTTQLAGGGQTGLTQLEAIMRHVTEATTTIATKLAILSEKTTNINSVVTTINKVADQTNLLSLNAAIEAEKAGEFGHGFAVVATEIRRLADQTAVATHDIEQMVKEMQSAVSSGVMGVDKFKEEVRRATEEVGRVTAQLAQIIQQVQTLTPRFDAVNEGMQTQTTAAGQISDALGQLGDTVKQSAEAFRQNTEVIEQLAGASRGLQQAVASFKVE